jgi:DNA-binding GntR family transcriptional regulator
MAEINRRLKMHHHEKLYRQRRLLLVSERPNFYSLSCLPCRLFPGFDEFPRSRFERVPLYLADHFLMSAVAAEAEIAALLRIPKGQPILTVEMLAFTYRNRPYE